MFHHHVFLAQVLPRAAPVIAVPTQIDGPDSRGLPPDRILRVHIRTRGNPRPGHLAEQMLERRAENGPSGVGARRWGWECERDWWGSEAAQGDGVCGHSDWVRIRGSPALPAPDLDAVRSPRPSTVPIPLFCIH